MTFMDNFVGRERPYSSILNWLQ